MLTDEWRAMEGGQLLIPAEHWHYKQRTRRPLPSPPKLVPYDFETGPLMLKVRHKTTGHLARACIAPNGFALATFLPHDIRAISFEALLKDYVQLDGSPCGKLVQ